MKQSGRKALRAFLGALGLAMFLLGSETGHPGSTSLSPDHARLSLEVVHAGAAFRTEAFGRLMSDLFRT